LVDNERKTLQDSWRDFFEFGLFDADCFIFVLFRILVSSSSPLKPSAKSATIERVFITDIPPNLFVRFSSLFRFFVTPSSMREVVQTETRWQHKRKVLFSIRRHLLLALLTRVLWVLVLGVAWVHVELLAVWTKAALAFDVVQACVVRIAGKGAIILEVTESIDT
jgi:hypothetical protein